MGEELEEVKKAIAELRDSIAEAEREIERAKLAGIDVSRLEAELSDLKRSYESMRLVYGEA